MTLDKLLREAVEETRGSGEIPALAAWLRDEAIELAAGRSGYSWDEKQECVDCGRTYRRGSGEDGRCRECLERPW